MPRVVILDRDGVLNDPVWDAGDGRYESPLQAVDVRLTPGAVEGCRALQDAGWTLAVASNQPAAAKGKATQANLAGVRERVAALLAAGGVRVAAWHCCPHHPRATDPRLRVDCPCRKPRPGMLLDILRDHSASPADAWMVGDADSDMAAARAAGCRAVLVEHPLTTHRRTTMPDGPVLRAPDLAGAAVAILRDVG